jgi:hypothetical protein
MLPDILDGINTISLKVLPMVNTANILPDMQETIKVVLPAVDITTNALHNAKMRYLAENYIHIINMKSLVLNILLSKDGLELVPNNFSWVKAINFNIIYSPTSNFI